ncbi:MAG: hypothetical protein PHF86_12320 [Candidatus Nanoarchaeia archaeon]|nr:hypothetical protein [Candidatus Nanoarchaeia archaeon]
MRVLKSILMDSDLALKIDDYAKEMKLKSKSKFIEICILDYFKKLEQQKIKQKSR